jgi:hypothetical protein
MAQDADQKQGLRLRQDEQQTPVAHALKQAVNQSRMLPGDLAFEVNGLPFATDLDRLSFDDTDLQSRQRAITLGIEDDGPSRQRRTLAVHALGIRQIANERLLRGGRKPQRLRGTARQQGATEGIIFIDPPAAGEGRDHQHHLRDRIDRFAGFRGAERAREILAGASKARVRDLAFGQLHRFCNGCERGRLLAAVAVADQLLQLEAQHHLAVVVVTAVPFSGAAQRVADPGGERVE